MLDELVDGSPRAVHEQRVALLDDRGLGTTLTSATSDRQHDELRTARHAGKHRLAHQWRARWYHELDHADLAGDQLARRRRHWAHRHREHQVDHELRDGTRRSRHHQDVVGLQQGTADDGIRPALDCDELDAVVRLHAQSVAR